MPDKVINARISKSESPSGRWTIHVDTNNIAVFAGPTDVQTSR